ncbi:MAG: DUF6356 family protein [Alphaproteobacteria bacterium]
MIAKSLQKAFSDHPASVNETYSQHFCVASSFGWRMMFSGFACLIHGLLPFLFVTTGSRVIGQLHDEMVVNRVRREALEAVPEGAD